MLAQGRPQRSPNGVYVIGADFNGDALDRRQAGAQGALPSLQILRDHQQKSVRRAQPYQSEGVVMAGTQRNDQQSLIHAGN